MPAHFAPPHAAYVKATGRPLRARLGLRQQPRTVMAGRLSSRRLAGGRASGSCAWTGSAFRSTSRPRIDGRGVGDRLGRRNAGGVLRLEDRSSTTALRSASTIAAASFPTTVATGCNARCCACARQGCASGAGGRRHLYRCRWRGIDAQPDRRGLPALRADPDHHPVGTGPTRPRGLRPLAEGSRGRTPSFAIASATSSLIALAAAMSASLPDRSPFRRLATPATEQRVGVARADPDLGGIVGECFVQASHLQVREPARGQRIGVARPQAQRVRCNRSAPPRAGRPPALAKHRLLSAIALPGASESALS